jgi:hypothetical protein
MSSQLLVVHLAGPHVHFGAASLQPTCDMWILITPNPAVVHVYNSNDMEHHLIREAHLVEEIG